MPIQGLCHISHSTSSETRSGRYILRTFLFLYVQTLLLRFLFPEERYVGDEMFIFSFRKPAAYAILKWKAVLEMDVCRVC